MPQPDLIACQAYLYLVKPVLFVAVFSTYPPFHFPSFIFILIPPSTHPYPPVVIPSYSTQFRFLPSLLFPGTGWACNLKISYAHPINFVWHQCSTLRPCDEYWANSIHRWRLRCGWNPWKKGGAAGLGGTQSQRVQGVDDENPGQAWEGPAGVLKAFSLILAGYTSAQV